MNVANGTINQAYLKKQIRDQDIKISELRTIAKNHANAINDQSKFINALIAEVKAQKVRLDKLEYKRPKIIMP